MEATVRRGVLTVAVLIAAGAVRSVPVGEPDALRAASRWVGASSQFRQRKGAMVVPAYRARKVETRSLGTGAQPLYAVELEPEGFVILNSDRRLPPVIAYSEAGYPNFDDVPGNAFRAFLKDSMERNYKKVMGIPRAGRSDLFTEAAKSALYESQWTQLLDVAADEPPAMGFGGVTNGPFLSTSWNQNNHYNEQCPADVLASAYYDGRVPAGCVAVVGAQIMNYYQWPYRGSGSHRYTDTSGSITGLHAVVFSDRYDWGNMQASYNPWGAEPSNAVAAVSELIYETGVAVDMDYEHSGSSSSTSDLNDMMHQAFLYDKGAYFYNATNSPEVANRIRGDLLNSRPAEVSIPGHAVVADGHVDDGSSEYFHFNYGWGGANNSWYLIDDINGNPAVSCVSGLYPALIPVNRAESAITNQSADLPLEWVFAGVRTSAVQAVSVLHHALKGSVFSDPAESFSHFGITSTSDYKDWVVTNSGYSGPCFYKAPGGYSNREYHLTSIEKFIPGSGSQLQFHLKTYLASDVFRVMVSADDGQTFSQAGSYDPGTSWTLISVDLSSYAGREILIRFEYVVGSYYPSGGVWLDSISFSGGSWYDWDTLQTAGSLSGTVLSNLTDGTYTLALQAFDGTSWASRSPSFTVTVQTADSDNDGIPNSWELQYFGGSTNAVAGADPDGDGQSNIAEYVAGSNPTNSLSSFVISGVDMPNLLSGGYVVRWTAVTGRLYGVDWTNNLSGTYQPLATNLAWPQASYTDTLHNSMQRGFYRINVRMAP